MPGPNPEENEAVAQQPKEVWATGTSKVAPEVGSLEVEQAKDSHALFSKEEEDDAVYQQLLKDSQPMWLTDLMIARPCTIILGSLAALFGLAVIASVLGYFDLNPQENRDFLIWDDPMTKAWDMMVVGEEYVLANSGSSKEKPLQMTQMRDWNPLIFYRLKNLEGNMLDKKVLLKVLQIESDIRQMEDWKKVCLAESISDTTCSMQSFTSSLSFLGAGLADLNAMTQEEIEGAWETATTAQSFAMLSPLYQKLSMVSDNDGRLQYMRSFLAFGLPIHVNGIRYEDLLDRQLDQREFIREFQRTLLTYIETWETDPDLGVQILSLDVTQEMFQELANEDQSWASASLLFVLVFFIYKLESSFLGGMGVLLILMSFPLTQVINEGIFRNTYYSSLHILVIFIVLGIGADDIFVFMDGYKQSASMPEIKDDQRKRLAFAVRRSARATATTSSTTSVAFLANAFSPIMPIQSFGIYASIIIAANYFLIILIFPPVAVWHEKYLMGKWCPRATADNEIQVTNLSASGEQKIEIGRIEKFFGGSWNNMVKALKIPFIIAFFGWAVVAIIFAVKLTPLTQQEEFLPDDHPIMELQTIQTQNFGSGGVFNLAIDIYWGVKDINKDDVSMWDSVYIGEAIMDEEFSLESVEAQQSLLDFCSSLKEQTQMVLNNDVRCWSDGFQEYLAAEGLSMPIADPAEFNTQLSTWASTTQAGRTAVAGMQIGMYGGKLRYMKVQSMSQGNPLDPYDLKIPYYNMWEDFLADFKKEAPASMQSVQQTAGQFWAFMPSERAFLTSAFQGMSIATVFAFFVLLLATGNIIQAFISLLCVAVIIVSVLAIMYFQGWEIGISESISMVILIGFSVDYCVHLSADFMHSAHPQRSNKMQQAYQEMGISIFSGAITTFGSGVFLFMGQIIMFKKFAVLITSTITISFFTSMVLFGAIMHTIGPEKGFGDVSNFCKKKSA